MRYLGRLRVGSLPAVALVVVVAWALFAVYMLTGTIISAQQIQHRVGLINSEVTPIDKDLQALNLAAKTGQIAGEIRAAALPLVGKLDKVVAAGGRIDNSVKSVLTSADSINGTVKMINGTVKTINTNVGSIGSALSSIKTNATSINSTVHGIDSGLSTTLTLVGTIRERVVGINTRAGAVISDAQGIKSDLDGTLAQLPGINANAAAIANSPLLLNNTGLNQLGQALGVGPLQPPTAPAPQPVSPLAPGVAPLAPLLPATPPVQTAPLLPAVSDTGPLGQLLGGVGGVLGH